MPGIRLVELTALILTVGVLSGCATAVIGAGAAVGVAAYQERGIGGRAQDLRLGMAVRERLLQHDHTLLADVDVTSYEGRLLLTGAVADDDRRAEAARLAAAVPGVRAVINEIVVAETDLLDTSRDAWISAKLETRITLDRKVNAVNYAVTTTDGTIFLIGIAQDQAELDRVIAHARDIARVRRVVSHVRLKQAPVDLVQAGT